ncbi:MAG: PIN domain-containing protein [Candidatus Odinarchaeota archaeon]|nr:PIN domain-containing protein [Candidatus Odinarchaeota archaeon]
MTPKIFLDTTYLLPLFGFDIMLEKKDENKLLKIIENLKPLISSLSILESKWKVLHFSKKNKALLERYPRVLQFITLSGKFQIIHFYDHRIDTLATKIYEIHKDYIDCSILATAVYNATVLLTEDSKIRELGEIVKKRDLLPSQSKKIFKVMSITEYKFDAL